MAGNRRRRGIHVRRADRGRDIVPIDFNLTGESEHRVFGHACHGGLVRQVDTELL
jgi:hypothetical protein